MPSTLSPVEAIWIGKQVFGVLFAAWVTSRAWGDWYFANHGDGDIDLEMVTLRSLLVIGLLLASKLVFLGVGVLAATIPERIYHEEESQVATIGLILGDSLVDAAIAAEAFFRWLFTRRERRS